MPDINLTPKERKAIAALKRLAKTWPESLLAFGSGDMGQLSIRKGGYGRQFHVAWIDGIRADGGDGSDVFD